MKVKIAKKHLRFLNIHSQRTGMTKARIVERALNIYSIHAADIEERVTKSGKKEK